MATKFTSTITLQAHTYLITYWKIVSVLSELPEKIEQNTVRFSTKMSGKTQERVIYKFLAKDDKFLVQWKDNKVVTLTSNVENDSNFNKGISQPKLITNYNKEMGDVDKMNRLIALYKIKIRQGKW